MQTNKPVNLINWKRWPGLSSVIRSDKSASGIALLSEILSRNLSLWKVDHAPGHVLLNHLLRVLLLNVNALCITTVQASFLSAVIGLNIVVGGPRGQPGIDAIDGIPGNKGPVGARDKFKLPQRSITLFKLARTSSSGVLHDLSRV